MNQEESSVSRTGLEPVIVKLQAFAGGLTAEERAQVLSLPEEDVTGMLSPSLETKARQAARNLTPEEAAQLRLLLQRARAGAAAGGEMDAEGYMKRLEVELDMPPEAPGGSLTWGAANFAIAALTVVAGLTGAGYGQPGGQPS